MSKEFSVEILTPGKLLLKEKANEVVLPSYDGETGILPEHGDFVGVLGFGLLKIRSEAGEHCVFVDTGVYQVSAGNLSIFASRAEKRSDIDLEASSSKVAELEGVFSDHERFSPSEYESQLEELHKHQARIEVYKSTRSS